MDNKSFKVNLEYYPGHYCPPKFVNDTDLVEAAKKAYEEFGRRLHIKEIIEDKFSIEPRLFKVIYYHSVDNGYDDDLRCEHHRGFVQGKTEQEAWKSAELVAHNNKYWPERITEIKVDSMRDLMNYLTKNFN